ncbi:hypothetical protein CKAN_00739400 [Cinnamomum micranthum f. kanehirae]|uniref:DUF2828 domain-containing protein n=1 Tax=Cinnamomum micranthum f. kanehirae TaxID=337451 RepID=A0A443NJW9_9MAGN|nr:hypothetical protein CKAN_00739400 [Cinnamomum micranthum f. kanehirae]
MNYLSPFRSILRRILSTTCKFPKRVFSSSSEYTMPPPSPTTSQNHLPVCNFRDEMTTPFNNNQMGVPKTPTGLTENVSLTFQSSGNPCLDFFNMVPYAPSKTVRELLWRAWAHNPLTTLKLILRLGMNSDHGDMVDHIDPDELASFTVVLWLHQNHPKTLALNVRWFAEIGYMHFLLDILFPKEKTAKRVVEWYNSDSNYRFLYDKISDFLAQSLKSDIGFMNSGEFRKIGLSAKWVSKSFDPRNIAKWLSYSFERSTLLRESIAKRVFPRESDPSYAEIEEADYSYRVCDRLTKEILAPLDEFLRFPDELRNLHMLYIYERVASVVRKTYNNALEKLEPERFLEFLAELNEGYMDLSEKYEPELFFDFLAKLEEWEAKNAEEDLLPHEILSYTNIDDVKELQWKRMVEDRSKKGKLSNCLSVCDVSWCMNGSGRKNLFCSKTIAGKVGEFSRSMAATRMEVCVALGLLTSELRAKSHGEGIQNPQLHRIQGKTLQEKVEFIKRMEWEMNIDFRKVFDRILDVAVASKLEAEKMVKRVFVFSDMGFEKAMNSWETDYHAIHKKYQEKGYGSSVPEIVFWNMNDLASYWMRPPMAGREKGCSYFSGFSKNLLNIFLDNGGVVNPEEVMEEAIAREEYQRLPMGFTENFSPTFLSTGNPCLDFFFHVVPDTPPGMVTELLRLSWASDPLTTLKLICHLRGVRGTGKSDKEGFYTAVFWLHQNHPKTLALNVRWFAEFGYMKDLLEILFRQLAGPDAREIEKQQWRNTKGRSRYRYQRRKSSKQKPIRNGSQEERVLAEKERAKVEKEKARESRKNRTAEMARRVVEKFNSDSNYRLLHDKISDFFAESLKLDIGFLNSGEFRKIGLAAKWCPSLDLSFDRSTLLCESIAKRVFPRESDPSYSEIEEAHYSYRVRDRLRKEILVPLRKSLELPEVYISENRWGELPYERVASVAMKTYKKLFMKHDPKRFSEFLAKVKEGKAKIAAGALLPHEILSFRGDDMETGIDEVSELQWKRMVEDFSRKGKLRNSLSVCDVSGSMFGTPMDVCLALGLLTSELSEEPWRGNVITFSANPQLHIIEGETLQEKVEFIKGMEWGMNTDFQKVFDRILDVAVATKLEEEKMVKRVFVFSDMEFDQASANSWETDYEVIQRKYKEKGYGSSVPEIVFWNLRDSRATPVAGREKGVALVSGFSKNLLTIFLDKDGVVNPEGVMEAAVAGEEYQKLTVFD